MAVSDEKWMINKLGGTNWATWKFLMKHLLLVKELWGVVSGLETLEEGADADVRSNFEMKSKKAFSTLALAIGTSQLYLVTDLVTHQRRSRML